MAYRGAAAEWARETVVVMIYAYILYVTVVSVPTHKCEMFKCGQWGE
jgi:hypothetical protein